MISPWRGDALTLNTGVSPREESVSSLSQILQDDPPTKYYLTRKACMGILRRASERGKELPEKLKRALEIQAGIVSPDGKPTELEAYHINQRDEGILGLAVWHNGHIGVYIGNSYVIEAMGTKYGVVKTRLTDRNWTHWLEIEYINYD